MMSQSQYPVPSWMFGAVQNVESGGNPNAVSSAGAIGPMQTMPSTLSDPGFSVMPARDNSPQEQQRVGNDYLGAMFQRYQDPKLALMAYNWGPGHVDKLVNGQLSPNQIPAETQVYPDKVMAVGKQYAQNQDMQTDTQIDPKQKETELLLKARARLRLQSENPDQQSFAQSISNPEAGKYLDALTAGAYAPFKPIVDNSIEALKNAATTTGEEISNPNPNAPWLLQRAGQVGNALQGMGEALFSPVTGATTASAEATMPLQERILGVSGLTSQQEHQIAQEEGRYIAGGVGGAMGANAKTSMLSQQEEPAALSRHPLTVALDKMRQDEENAPKAGFWESNSSDPRQAATPETPSNQMLYDKANESYKAAEVNGGILSPQAVDKAIQKAADNAGYQSAEGKDFAGESDVAKTLNDLQRRSGKPLTLLGAQEIDEDLSDRIDAHFDKINGLDKQGAKLVKIQQALRDTYKNAGENDIAGGRDGFDSWRQGQQLWSAARHADDIQRILDRGESADVPATAYKNGFKALSSNEARMRGFTPEEQAAIKHAAKTGILTGALKTIGGKFTSGVAGGLGGAMGGGLPGAFGGMIAGEAIGFPFRAGANALARGRGTNILDLIGQRPDVQAAFNPQYPRVGFNGQ